jgi:hypothetical protein|tara:strand:- start:139 stop:429 length:291 start_codon:yes stop_codon:yes gene_type:complete
MSKSKKYIDEVISNIRDDREITKELLTDAIKWLSKDESRHREIGIVMAKYVETLQRSNEQLVKVVGLMEKNNKEAGLSQKDKDELFDLIGNNDDNK